MEKEKMIKTKELKRLELEAALDLKAPLSTLKKYKNYSDLVTVETPYSIERIRKGFALYNDREITKEYFFLWCELCKRVIEVQCQERCHVDAAKQEISWRLSAVAEGESPKEMLKEIEYLHLIVSGERKSDLWIAEDLEIFSLWVGENDWGYIYDVITLNHYRKIYVVSREVWDMDLDSTDAFDDMPKRADVSKTFFNLILDNLPALGYEEKDEV